MARRISVEIIGDASSLQRAFRNAGGAASGFERRLRGFGRVGRNIGFGAVTTGVAAIAASLVQGSREFAAQAKVAAQTNAVLKSTGGVANVSAERVDELATSLLRKSGIDDEVIKSGQNVLLTFRGIRNETGKGNKIFDQATRAVLDLSVAMDKDLDSAAVMVGKALNDPVRGLTALRRVGVQFTKSQEAQIKALVKSGKVMDAQKIIIKELNTEFGGSAKALGDTLPGKIARLRESWANLSGDLISKVAPALAGALEGATRFVEKLSDAKGFKAKFNVVWTGIKGAARRAIDGLGKAFKEIDWDRLWKETKKQIGVWADQLGRFLSDVDYNALGKKVGRALGDALVFSVKALVNLPWKQIFIGVLKGIVALAQIGVGLIRELAPKMLQAGYILGKELAKGIAEGLVKELPRAIVGAAGSLGSGLRKRFLDAVGVNAGPGTGPRRPKPSPTAPRTSGPRGPSDPTAGIIPGEGRAKGGPVMPGVAYRVGERGPETFVPGAAGSIVANGAGGGIHISGDLHFHGVNNVRELITEIQRVASNTASSRRGRFGGYSLVRP